MHEYVDTRSKRGGRVVGGGGVGAMVQGLMSGIGVGAAAEVGR